MGQDNLGKKEWKDIDVIGIDTNAQEDRDAAREEPLSQGKAENVGDAAQKLPELGASDDESSELEEMPEDLVEDDAGESNGAVSEGGEGQKLPMEESAGDEAHNPSKLDQAMADVNEEVKRLQKEIAEVREKERIRLGNDFFAMMLWARKREKIEPLNDTFYAFEDAWKKARAMIEPLKPYIDHLIYKDVLFSTALHYIICEPFEFYIGIEENVAKINPLYQKHGIVAKSYIISSASDESSSSSIHATKSLNDGDFVMQDLLRTRYGTWVYSILEQMDIGAVLL